MRLPCGACRARVSVGSMAASLSLMDPVTHVTQCQRVHTQRTKRQAFQTIQFSCRDRPISFLLRDLTGRVWFVILYSLSDQVRCLCLLPREGTVRNMPTQPPTPNKPQDPDSSKGRRRPLSKWHAIPISWALKCTPHVPADGHRNMSETSIPKRNGNDHDICPAE
jgi:hypothetical protein